MSATHGQNSFEAWPASPRVPDRRPDSFSKTFGYTMLAQQLRFLGGSAKGLTSPERLMMASIADGIEAGVSDDLDGMHDALDATAEMERCR